MTDSDTICPSPYLVLCYNPSLLFSRPTSVAQSFLHPSFFHDQLHSSHGGACLSMLRFVFLRSVAWIGSSHRAARPRSCPPPCVPQTARCATVTTGCPSPEFSYMTAPANPAAPQRSASSMPSAAPFLHLLIHTPSAQKQPPVEETTRGEMSKACPLHTLARTKPILHNILTPILLKFV